MSKKIFLCALFLLCGSFSLVAQTVNQQWEYLIWAEYGDPNFNDLGQKSWELVGVVPPSLSEGTTNGVAKFIFKRPFDSFRSSQEAELKKRNEEQTKQAQVEFINLDAVEIKSAQKEDEEKAKAKIGQAIKQVKGFSVLSFKPYAWFPSVNDRRIGGEIVIDGSKELLKDSNKYRSSEVDKFIRQAANEIYRAAELKPKYANQEPFAPYFGGYTAGVSFKLSIVVIYNGVTKTLAEGIIQGDWDKTPKP